MSQSKNHGAVTHDSNFHRLFALEAAGDTESVLQYFERERPNNHRLRQAIQPIRPWAKGKRKLGMAEVRRLSLASHAATREARSAPARFAAGHAVALWHVPTHAVAVPAYASKAIAVSKKELS